GWSLGGGRPPDGLTGRGWDLRGASAATRRPLHLAHQRSALVADVGRHGVEGAARRAWLRAHLAHLLFLAEPVFEGEEGGLLAPPFLELGFAQAAAQLSRGFLLEPGDHFVILEAHLLLVIGHLQLTRRELDAALRALLHVDRDPGLAVRALRHVPFELDAALRARRRVLRDEGAALAALDHLAEAVDLPVQRHADRDGRRGRQDDQDDASDALRARVPHVSRDAQRASGDNRLAYRWREERREPGRRRLDVQGHVREVVALLRRAALVDRVVRVDDDLKGMRPDRTDAGHVQRLIQGRDHGQAIHPGDLGRAVSIQ